MSTRCGSFNILRSRNIDLILSETVEIPGAYYWENVKFTEEKKEKEVEDVEEEGQKDNKPLVS